MKKWEWYCVFLVVVILGCPLFLSAETVEKESICLEEVVVSATRSEIPVFDAAQSVTVLSRKEIMASPFERVEDIVRSVPGVYNYRHFALQTNGVASPLKMRGAGSNRVLILVDGVPQNDNFNNAISWVAWGHIPKETIERIEIVRGPTSALYGSEGLGGVIHIITRTPRAGAKTSIRGEIGSADTYGGFGAHSRKVDDLGLLIAGGYEESDGFYMVENPASYTIKRYREVGRIFGKIAYDLTSNSDISLSALYYDHETGKGRQFFYDELTLDQYWMKYNIDGDALDFKGLVYLNRADKTAFQDTASDNYASLLRMEEMPSTTWGADLQGTLPIGNVNHLTFGAAYKDVSWDYDNEYVASTRDAGADGRQRTISPFVNLDLRFLNEDLIFNLGVRYDRIETSDGKNWDSSGSAGKPAYSNTFNSMTEDSISPKVGIAWHPDDETTIRFSGGKGFRAPSLFELYKVHIRSGGTYYREANPDLKPEKLWSYDVGVERFLTKCLWGKISFYQSFAEDYIGDRLTGTGNFGGGKTRYEYQLDNISEVDIYGVETELELSLYNHLTIFANYTYNVSEIKKDENNAALEGKYLTKDPRHSAHGGFRYQNPEIINFSAIVNYYADIYFDNENTLKEDGYFTVDLSASRKFFDWFTTSLSVENLFDEEYPISRSLSSGDTLSPGLVVTGGVKFEF